MKYENIIECLNLTYFYNKVKILENINLSLKEGTITTIIGPNGGGKTTLGKIIAGSLKPSHGKVIKQQGKSIGYMPQKIHLNHLMPITAKQFLKLSLNNNTISNSFRAVVKQQNIENLLNTQLCQLSGGQLQRVLFARLLISEPDIMVLDEPTEGLDIKGQDEFYINLDKLSQVKKKTILLISHDLHTVMSSSNRVLCLDKSIKCSGLPKSISNNKNYTDMFFKKRNSPISYYEHSHKG